MVGAMSSIATQTVRTLVPARLDRLPWSRWHWLIIMSLGTVWILDGLEVTIKGAVGPSLQDSIGFSTVQVAGSASIYLFGAITGALLWGYATDRFGRHLIFILTLLTYMIGVVGTTLSGVFDAVPAYTWFAVFRCITGFGIGGEYAAVNSAVDELIPARRGWAASRSTGAIGSAAPLRPVWPCFLFSTCCPPPTGGGPALQPEPCSAWASSCSGAPFRKAPAG